MLMARGERDEDKALLSVKEEITCRHYVIIADITLILSYDVTPMLSLYWLRYHTLREGHAAIACRHAATLLRHTPLSHANICRLAG